MRFSVEWRPQILHLFLAWSLLALLRRDSVFQWTLVLCGQKMHMIDKR